MRKSTILIAFSMALFASCGGAKTNKNAAEPVATLINNPTYDEGLELAVKSDCFTCHKIAEASIGPAYEVIAAKYADNPENISLLAAKVINGGVGVWGQVPMNAHPTMTKTDAEKIIKYILLLKK